MLLLQQSESTAAQRRIPVLLVDSGDGFSSETGVLTPTIEISKNGAAQAAGVGTWVEIGEGLYYYELTAAELNTVGFVNVRVIKTGVSRQFQGVAQVVAFDPYSAANLGLTNLDAAVSSRSSHSAANVGSQITADHGSGSYQTATGFSSHSAADVWTVTPRTLTSFGTLIADIWHHLLTAITTAGSIGRLIKDNIDATISSRSDFNETTDPVELLDSGGAAGTSAAELVVDVTAQVTSDHGAGSYQTATGFSTHTAADVWTVTTRTLSSFGTLVADIWHQLLTGITLAGSIGRLLKDNIDAAITTRATPAQVNTEVDNALDTAIPALPTANSINERIKQIDENPNDYKADVSGLATSADLATVDSNVDSIKLKTDQLSFTAGNVHSNVQVNSDKTGYALTAAEKTAIRDLILSDGITFSGADISLIRKMLTNSEELDSLGKKTTFDDDGTTPINEKNAFDKNDVAVTKTGVDAGIPVKYTKV